MNIDYKVCPSSWIVKRIEDIDNIDNLNILDFASGNGRHSISLANQKRKITAIDIDSKKLDKYKNYKNIQTICFDLETNQKWPLKKNEFDLVIVTNYLFRPKIKKIGDLVKENGYLFYETFAVGNEKFGRPTNPNYLLRHRELIQTFKNKFDIKYYFNGKISDSVTSVIQRCVLKKRVSQS